MLTDGVKEIRQRGSVGGGGRRNAVKKGARVGSFPNPDGSKRKRARTIRISMEAMEGPKEGRCSNHRFEGRGGRRVPAGSGSS